MNATMLPTEPELPQHRQDEIRTELLRSLDVDRRQRRPVLAAAVASVLAVGVGVGVTSWQLSSGGDSPGLAPASADKPPIPGLSVEERAEIERGCDAAIDRGNQHRTNDWPTGDYTLYNVAMVDDNGQGVGLLFNLEDSVAELCILRPQGEATTCPGQPDGRWCFAISLLAPFNDDLELSDDRDLRWLPGRVTADHYLSRFSFSMSSNEGVDDAYPALSSMRVFAGRVDDGVARVTVSNPDGESVDARVLNNSFVAVGPDGSLGDRLTLRGYDADGALVAETQIGNEGCYVTPDGKVIHGEPQPSQECKPAVPWPPAN